MLVLPGRSESLGLTIRTLHGCLLMGDTCYVKRGGTIRGVVGLERIYIYTSLLANKYLGVLGLVCVSEPHSATT